MPQERVRLYVSFEGGDMSTPEGYYATVVDAEDFDRYADDEADP